MMLAFFVERLNCPRERGKNSLKLSEEKKMRKNNSFFKINSMREETVEYCVQHSILVIVMFVSRASTNAFLPDSLIIL